MKFKGRLPHTPICVDEFTLAQLAAFQTSSPLSHACQLLFFLSHMHGDHTAGLTHCWNSGTIYCTNVTKTLLIAKYSIDSAMIVELNENCATTLPLSSALSASSLTFTVTTVPVSHCPGACAFIFDGYWGRIVYTGDLLYDSQTRTALRSALLTNKVPVNVAYVDNTFASPLYPSFVSRSQCVSLIVSIIATHTDTDILLNSDLIGKEDVLVLVAHRCRALICVDAEKYTMLRAMYDNGHSFSGGESDSDDHVDSECLAWPHWLDCFTTREDETFIRVWPKREVTRAAIEAINARRSASQRPVIGIHMSGWSATGNNANNIRPSIHQTFYHIPYSAHSSFTQLKSLIEDLRPRELLAISNDSYDWSWCRDSMDMTVNAHVAVPPQLCQPLLGEKRRMQHHLSNAMRRRRVARRRSAFAIDGNKSANDEGYDSEDVSELIDISSDSEASDDIANTSGVIDFIPINDDVTTVDADTATIDSSGSDGKFNSDDTRHWSLRMNPLRMIHRPRLSVSQHFDIIIDCPAPSSSLPSSLPVANQQAKVRYQYQYHTRTLPSFLSAPLTEERLRHLEHVASLPKTKPLVEHQIRRIKSLRKPPLPLVEVGAARSHSQLNRRPLPPLFAATSETASDTVKHLL